MSKIVKSLFGLSVLINIALLTGLLTLVVIQVNDSAESEHSVREKPCATFMDYQNHGRDRTNKIFADLNLTEIESTLRYLYEQESMNLVKPSKAEIRSNYIYLIEVNIPRKSEALQFLDHSGPLPRREAVVTIFKGEDNPPSVAEYIVGSLPEPTYHYLSNRTARHNPVSYRLRPYNYPELEMLLYKILPKKMKSIEKILYNMYGAVLFNCTDLCLTFSISPISSIFDTRRKFWFTLLYNLEFPTLHPIDFQFLVDVDSLDPENWRLEKIWHDGVLYNSVQNFVQNYSVYENVFNRRPISPMGKERFHGFLSPRGTLYPEHPSTGPKQYEPAGKRYKIHTNRVFYMKWSFDYRISPIKGLQIFNVKFDGERIIYELSLQEIVVLYSGYNPTFMYNHIADSAGLPGRSFGLVGGVDCPHHATFQNSTLFTEDFDTAAVYPNALCIFEFNKETPLRRHHSNSVRGGYFYAGLRNEVLVMRTIAVIFNYDYIFDYIFYQNGAVEVKVHLTGYLYTSKYFLQEMRYGVPISDHITANMHIHLFNFKVDLDILGTKNRYETWDISVNNSTNPWNKTRQQFYQYQYKRNLKQSELAAAYRYDFDFPKYHVISKGVEVGYRGTPRGYKIAMSGMVNQLLPENFGMEGTISWSRYQMAITRHKEEEQSSSSINALFDSGNSVINFEDFIRDDENIVDKDLVAWVTIGAHHIPHTEDVPNVVTAGHELSIFISPFNYFPEDPSIGSRSALRLVPNDVTDPKTGMKVEQDADDTVTCLPRKYSYDLLKTDSSNIFKL